MFRAARNQQRKRKAIFPERQSLPNCGNPSQKQSPLLKLPENRPVCISYTTVVQQQYCSVLDPTAQICRRMWRGRCLFVGVYLSSSQMRGQDGIKRGYARSQFLEKATEVSISDVLLETEREPAFLPWGLWSTLQAKPGRSDMVAQRRGRHGKDAKGVACSKQ